MNTVQVFKMGDQARCTNSDSTSGYQSLFYHSVYTIEESWLHQGKEFVRLKGIPGSWSAERFENVSNPLPKKPAIEKLAHKAAGIGKPANPKKIFGDKKPRLSLVPLSGQLAQFEAQYDGALKYGEVNWRENPVEIMTYIDAALRHLLLFASGEELARDTKVQNLGAVMACCSIIIDAGVHGTLIDNRSHSPQTCDLLHEAEAKVTMLRKAQEEREIAKNGK